MDDYDKEYFSFCIEALQQGSLYMSKGRYHIRHNGRSVALARALWNYWHLDDPVLITDIIHHRNGDKSDDRWLNLEKMPAGEHIKWHTMQKRGYNNFQEEKDVPLWIKEIANDMLKEVRQLLESKQKARKADRKRTRRIKKTREMFEKASQEAKEIKSNTTIDVLQKNNTSIPPPPWCQRKLI
jgi:hypothetical protein